MNVYTVRFCDKEFEAHNLRDFARIAVFAKWYLRSQAISDKMQCSIQQKEHATASRSLLNTLNTESIGPRTERNFRRQRTSTMRKAIRTFFYNFLY